MCGADGADPADTDHDCQGTDNWLAVPEGWSLAPHDADSIAAVAAHGWGTHCLALADGSTWFSANSGSAGDSCGRSGYLATCEAGRVTTGDRYDASQGTWIPNGLVGDSCPAASGLTYTVASCKYRVLLRCP